MPNAKKDTQAVEVVFSFDTTGSMYACLAQVRRKIEETVTRLFKAIPNLRVGIMAHGDYCDRRRPYITKIQQLTNNLHDICEFVRNVEPTNGGDSPEAYELVLHQARRLNWTDAKSKVLVIIGDDVPHGPMYPENTERLDWRNEINLLLKMGVQVYGVQALDRPHATHFYREIAQMTGGYHLKLDQFEDVSNLILAICYKQASPEILQLLEKEVEKTGRMNRSMDDTFARLSGREKSTRFTTARPTEAASIGHFQVMRVYDDQSIREFVEANGLVFQKGKGYYEFTKAETIQEYKEVVLVNDGTGDIFYGDTARQKIGLPIGERTKAKPNIPAGHTAYVQSTSYNRKLIGGTRFLYEVDLTR